VDIGIDVGDAEGPRVGTPVGALDLVLSGRHTPPFSEMRTVA
jgi:hypothetical protein